MGNVNMEASQINYRGGEKKMSVEEALKNTSGEAAAIAQLQTDVLNLNSNKANQITIAPFFSAEASYDPGDLVYYNGLSYRCVNAHEGEWDADDFAATTIAGELDSLKSGLIGVGITESGIVTVDLSTYTASHGNNIYYYDVSLPLTDLPSGIKLCQLVAWSGIGASAWCVLDGDSTKLRIIMDGSPVSPSTATITVRWFK